MTQLLVISIATLILAGSSVFVLASWRKVGVLGIYTLMVGLYFGLQTIVDVLVDDVGSVAPLSAALALGSVAFAILLTWLLYLMLPTRIRKTLRLQHLMVQWQAVDSRGVTLAALLVIVFQAYLYVDFGILSHIYQDDLATFGIAVPTWIGPTRELANGVAFGAILYYFAKIFGRARLGWTNTLVLVTLVTMVVLLGRRAMLNISVIGLLMGLLAMKGRLASMKGLTIASLTFLTMVFAANIYQTYRQQLAFSVHGFDFESPRLVDAAMNFQPTFENLEVRRGVWRFNEQIVAEHLDAPLNVLGGQLTWQALVNSIPKAIWQTKEVVDIDEMIAIHYGFEITDYPTTNFSTLQADFGFAMPLVSAALIFATLAMIVVARRGYGRGSFLYLMSSGFVLLYLMNIENSLGSIFTLFRDIVLITSIVLGVELIRSSWRFVVRSAAGRSVPKPFRVDGTYDRDGQRLDSI